MFPPDPILSTIIFHLQDIDPVVCEAWKQEFSDCANVKIDNGDIISLEADAVISPSNSFGFMTYGIDTLYLNRFGNGLMIKLQEILQRDFNGFLPVSMATIVPTGDNKIPYLISAPTVSVPSDISNTLNAFLAFKAALEVIRIHNIECESNPEKRKINSVLCPGLGTSGGKMPAARSAFQMRHAYNICVLKNISYPLALSDGSFRVREMLGYAKKQEVEEKGLIEKFKEKVGLS